MGITRFERADLELFGAASQDRNPLHLSDDYAHKTTYGEPVVFGVLGALAGLAQLPPRPGSELSSLRTEFRHPLVTGVDYRVDVDNISVDTYRIRILDAE